MSGIDHAVFDHVGRGQSAVPDDPVEVRDVDDRDVTLLGKGMTGVWELSNSERDRVCNLTFKSEPARNGSHLWPPMA